MTSGWQGRVDGSVRYKGGYFDGVLFERARSGEKRATCLGRVCTWVVSRRRLMARRCCNDSPHAPGKLEAREREKERQSQQTKFLTRLRRQGSPMTVHVAKETGFIGQASKKKHRHHGYRGGLRPYCNTRIKLEPLVRLGGKVDRSKKEAIKR